MFLQRIGGILWSGEKRMLRKRWLWKTFLAAAVYGFLPCWAALLRHGENLNEFILYVLGGKIFSPLNNPPVLLFAFIPTYCCFFYSVILFPGILKRWLFIF